MLKILKTKKNIYKVWRKDLKLNRIQIKCANGNNASKNIPKRLGFVYEGLERNGELLSDGKYVDLETYSKLKSEQ